jgi:hypothetical protein
MTGLPVVLPGATAVALTFPRGLTFDEWEANGRVLARVDRASKWWLGDWLNFGEDRFGERYVQVTGQLGLDEQTLMNYAWVARAFPHSARAEQLTWRHHQEVAALEPTVRAALLAQARAEGWSTRALRAEIRRQRTSPPIDPSPVENVTALCEALEEALPAGWGGDDPMHVRWLVASRLAEAGVLVASAVTGAGAARLRAAPDLAACRLALAGIARGRVRGPDPTLPRPGAVRGGSSSAGLPHIRLEVAQGDEPVAPPFGGGEATAEHLDAEGTGAATTAEGGFGQGEEQGGTVGERDVHAHDSGGATETQEVPSVLVVPPLLFRPPIQERAR